MVGFVAYAGQEVTWLYVHLDHRGRGVGRELLRRAPAHASDQGAGRVEVTVPPGT